MIHCGRYRVHFAPVSGFPAINTVHFSRFHISQDQEWGKSHNSNYDLEQYLYFRLLKFLNSQISEATRVRHFTLHHSLLATILKRLPAVAENLGKRLFKPFLEEFMGSARIDHVTFNPLLTAGNHATVLQNSESTILTGRHLLRLRERQWVGQGGRRAGGVLPQRVPGTQHLEGARGAIPSEVSWSDSKLAIKKLGQRQS